MRVTVTTALLALALTACGDGGERDGVATLASGGPSASASASVGIEDAFREYAKCMRANGVDLPDPDEDGGGLVMAPSAAPREVQEADAKCGPILKNAVRDNPKLNDPAMADRALEFARCMRANGIDMPDPGTDGSIKKPVDGHPGTVTLPFDPEDPKFREAQQACSHLFGPKAEGGK